LLAANDGVFVEPASAASVAGLLKFSKKNKFKNKDRVVCVLTGHGLKDPDRAIKTVKAPRAVPAKLKAVLKEIGY